MLYYLGYMTIDKVSSSSAELTLKVPNRFMSGLFGKCTVDYRFRKNANFNDETIDLTALTLVQDDISSFAQSCSDFLSKIMTNQMLSHMNEMSLNMVVFAKLDAMEVVKMSVRMQKSVQVPRIGEKFADLVITVNKETADECIYLLELKYLTKQNSLRWDMKKNSEN